ncbi:hypothetical protein SARC_11203 [Sphaeroforma arctica JP610]|uniref:EF-hand domain-containing protein n=1 Tax=Sphaeroforma arctica JP610 TaxID=667725 RepID=A0A0L0FIH6_9EUKA|nr:hypothetical protein SARC_11203 [Sphaeroforma arctica JP610]KNC76286.1 hypothetical protein SARC_11203 [Sphaeroforma arctica JP610]|eukprot:XP_014150188.1 hypothetical protein SARC_11203 [Sphaeroforma arctica JP610]
MLETKKLTDLLEEALCPMNRSLKKKHIKRRERVISANEIAVRAMCVQFIKFSSRDACLHIDEFYSAFKELDRDHARVLFDKVFDMNKDGVISFSEFKTTVNDLLSLDRTARSELMFDMVDSDKSGTIEYAELLALLHNGRASSKVVLSDSDARSLVDNFITSAISRKSSTLDYEQVHIPRADFVHWMQRTDTDRLLDLSATVLSWMKSESKNSYSTKSHTYWLRNHQREVGGAFVWLAATVIISVYAFHTYYNQVPYISFGLAKLGAWNIMMNTCFLYLLLMRNVLSWARQMWIFHIFNTHNHVADHVFIGKMIGIYSILHIVAQNRLYQNAWLVG